jgi:putative phosphoesterase
MEHKMRVAILSDIHGNIDALNAITSTTAFLDCDLYINAGDAIGYYLQPSEVIDKLIEFNFVSIKGNHEELLEQAASDKSLLAEMTLKYGIGHQACFDQLSKNQLEFLFHLPFSSKIITPRGNIEIFHGSPKSSNDYIYPDSNLEKMALQIPKDCMWLILGNTHWPMIRSIGNTTIINPGSVGQSRNGSGKAHWAILDTDRISISFIEEDYESSMLIEKLKVLNPGHPKLWEALSPK